MTTVTTAITMAIIVAVATLTATTMAHVITQTFATCTVPASLTRDAGSRLLPPPAAGSCADRVFGR